LRAPTTIRLEVTSHNGTSEIFERDGLLGEYRICRQTIDQIASEHNFVIDDPHISRRHCSFVWNGTADWLLQDLGSRSGTKCGDQPVLEEIVVRSGAEIRVGDSLVRIQFGPPNDRPWRRPTVGHAWHVDDEHTLIIPTYDSGVAALEAWHSSSDNETVINIGGQADGAANADASANSDADVTIMGRSDHQGPDATIISAPASEGLDATLIGTPATLKTAVVDATVIGALAKGQPDGPISTVDTGTGQTIGDDGATIITDPGQRLGVTAGSSATHIGMPDTGRGKTLLEEMRLAGLLNAEQAKLIQSQARKSGRTVFSTVVDDIFLTNQSAIHQWAAERATCRTITVGQELQEVVREADWLPLQLAEDAGVLMLETGDDAGVEYATTDPFDVLKRDWVARCEKQNIIRPVLVSPATFQDALNRLRRDLKNDDAGEIGVVIEMNLERAEKVRETLETQGIPMIVDFILFSAHASGASDIHVEPTEQSLMIRNRVDGILHLEAAMPAGMHAEVTSRIKILSGMDVAEKRRPQDGRISINMRQSPIDVRVSTFPTVYGEKIVMRLLDQSSLMPSPDHLGLGPRELAMLIDGLNSPYGLIMLCGPTGSGKTTTLYSCLGAIDKTTKNVLTVEDPVEYRLAGVHQMQVNQKIGLTFQQGLRNILRQDPDIIMVGECRDLETAEMAIQASLTGHIVFSTIHTNDAIGVVSRLLDMDIDPFLVATAMTLAIAQRLVRTICPECKTQVDGSDIIEKLKTDGVSDAKLELLGIEIDPELEYATGRGRDCNHCRGSGYLGRQAVFEVFQMTNECRQIVMAEPFNADELRALAARNGLSSLVQSGLDLVEQGVTTHEEVIRVLGETN